MNVLEKLTRAAVHHDPEIRQEGVRGLIEMGLPAQARLEGILDFHLEREHVPIAQALFEQGNETVTRRVARHLDSHRSPYRLRAAQVLGELGGAEVVPHLCGVLLDEPVLRALERIIARDPETRVPLVMPLLRARLKPGFMTRSALKLEWRSPCSSRDELVGVPERLVNPAMVRELIRRLELAYGSGWDLPRPAEAPPEGGVSLPLPCFPPALRVEPCSG